MQSLSFKTKILLLVIIPLILVSLALTLLSIYQARELGNKNVDSFSEMIFTLRRGELKNYTELAITAVKHLYENSDPNDLNTQEKAKEIYSAILSLAKTVISLYTITMALMLLTLKSHSLKVKTYGVYKTLMVLILFVR